MLNNFTRVIRKFSASAYVLVLLAFSLPTLAESDFEPPIASADLASAGPGATSCAKWAQVRDGNNRVLDILLTSWVQGFLSGMNTQKYTQLNQDVPALSDAVDIRVYVDKKCAENPSDNLHGVSMQLFAEID